MVTLHSTIGTLIILGYLATVIMYLTSGARPSKWARWVSAGSAVLLLIQYVIGFGLLGEGYGNNGWHYVLAFAALITVGLEHAVARPRGAKVAALAAAGTLVIVLLTYLIGQGTIG